MEKRRYAITVSVAWLIALVVVLGAVLGISYQYYGLVSKASAAPLAPQAAPRELASLQQAFISIAEQAKPSVVNISTEQEVKEVPQEQRRVMPDDVLEWFRRHFGDDFDLQMPAPERRPVRSLGSGVIITPQGHILTSSHVVRGADRVTVTLAQRKELSAQIVAVDPQTDLAVIKVNPEVPLRAAPLGNSDDEPVGSWVMAIGSPLGLEQTVTVGVISAKNRSFPNPNVEDRPFREMIQTDAAINRGNSGGPLVNIRGQVIGINTVIVSGTGFNIGLGFAIPINDSTKPIIETLKSGEAPTRGLLGVYIGPVNEAIARVYGVDKGAWVNEVMPDGPAEKAGIQGEDIIVRYGKQEIADEQELVAAVERTKPGTKVPVTVIRAGERKTLTVEIGEVPTGPTAAAEVAATGKLGLTVSNITPQLRQQYSIQPKQGVVVTEADPNGDGARAGLGKGDAIVKVNRMKITSVRDYNAAVKPLNPGDPVVIRAWRGDDLLTLTVRSLGE